MRHLTALLLITTAHAQTQNTPLATKRQFDHLTTLNPSGPTRNVEFTWDVRPTTATTDAPVLIFTFLPAIAHSNRSIPSRTVYLYGSGQWKGKLPAEDTILLYHVYRSCVGASTYSATSEPLKLTYVFNGTRTVQTTSFTQSGQRAKGACG